MTEVNLQAFCSADDFRPYTNKPFSRAGFTWATNGHIMVKVPLRNDIPEIERSPATETIFDKNFKDDDMRPLISGVELPALNTEDCPECGGDGTEHSCPCCQCRCDNCNGTGKTEEKASLKISGAFFALKYAKLLASLPGIRVASKVIDNMSPLPFTFDGGAGLLMPLRSPYDKHLDIEI